MQKGGAVCLPRWSSYISMRPSPARDKMALMLPRAMIVWMVCVAAFGQQPAQNTQAAQVIEKARQLSDIRAPNAHAFLLKATFSFINDDLDTIEGTYTETWLSSTRWRRETTIGSLRHLEIGGPGKYWIADDSDTFPEQASRVSTMLQMFPVRSVALTFDSTLDRESSGHALQCLVAKSAGIALCFDKRTGLMVGRVFMESIRSGLVQNSCQYTAFQKFGAYWFPHEMACFRETHRLLQAKVIELKTEVPADAALFTPPPGAVELGECSVAPVSPEAVSTPSPRVPSSASDRAPYVRMAMVVDLQGHPQNLRIERSGGKSFDDQAMRTVRNWRFNPGTCNGQPMAMEIHADVQVW